MHSGTVCRCPVADWSPFLSVGCSCARKQVQIHGPLEFAWDIEAIVVSVPHLRPLFPLCSPLLLVAATGLTWIALACRAVQANKRHKSSKPMVQKLEQFSKQNQLQLIWTE